MEQQSLKRLVLQEILHDGMTNMHKAVLAQDEEEDLFYLHFGVLHAKASSLAVQYEALARSGGGGVDAVKSLVDLVLAT
eukprot:NODE_6856_length_603_cov_2.523466_g5867_i0.p4 GENE.NODE_6856_length_603_cov_2.523466_g5867_i0~~NODE_6856_length_603_cov_2.523466_g5867_i0.p4  ORF type:complete len:79 (+),score=40.76 NODE_6856_length_603_cov_2.523466_g5867_i0:3-239(+)